MKATPIDEVYAVVAKKYFGLDPVAVKAELGFDKSTWTYDGGSTRPPSSAAARSGTGKGRTSRSRNTRISST